MVLSLRREDGSFYTVKVSWVFGLRKVRYLPPCQSALAVIVVPNESRKEEWDDKHEKPEQSTATLESWTEVGFTMVFTTTTLAA